VMGGSGRTISDKGVSLKQALQARGLDLVVSPTDDLDAALQAAHGADVVVACGGATSTESLDRSSLKLDQHWFLVALGEILAADAHGASTIATDVTKGTAAEGVAAGPRLVVLAMAPGAVLADWAAKADGAALMFLGGEQSGNGWADVLLGDTNPSGKLPLTLPLHESDTVAPCLNATCNYLEGLAVGWRALMAAPVAFCYGHGLSYSGRFGYEWLQFPAVAPAATQGKRSVLASMSLRITNRGVVAGREVVQLYLQFPSSAGEPKLVLRNFVKTRLLDAGEEEQVNLDLTSRDLSIWDVEAMDWRLVRGAFVVHVGSSSRDIRLQYELHVRN